MVGGNLIVRGSGSTFVLNADKKNAGFANINDSIEVSGDRRESGRRWRHAHTSQLGGENLGHAIDGVGAGPNVLRLDANQGGNITVNAEIGFNDPIDLAGRVDANNVTFRELVEIDGDLIINATGTVSFQKGVTLNSGGSLAINGANSLFALSKVSSR